MPSVAPHAPPSRATACWLHSAPAPPCLQTPGNRTVPLCSAYGAAAPAGACAPTIDYQMSPYSKTFTLVETATAPPDPPSSNNAGVEPVQQQCLGGWAGRRDGGGRAACARHYATSSTLPAFVIPTTQRFVFACLQPGAPRC